MVMRKGTLFGLLTLFTALAFCLAFAACSSEDSSPDADFIRVVGEIDGRLTETIINKSGNFGKAALEPASGQRYVIRFVEPPREIISEGTIQYNPPYILFIPAGQTAPAFQGFMDSGNNTLIVADIPYGDETFTVSGVYIDTSEPGDDGDVPPSGSAPDALTFTVTSGTGAVAPDYAPDDPSATTYAWSGAGFKGSNSAATSLVVADYDLGKVVTCTVTEGDVVKTGSVTVYKVIMDNQDNGTAGDVTTPSAPVFLKSGDPLSIVLDNDNGDATATIKTKSNTGGVAPTSPTGHTYTVSPADADNTTGEITITVDWAAT